MIGYVPWLCFLAFVLSVGHGYAFPIRIEAVVDGKVITNLDVERRVQANTFFYKTAASAGNRDDVLQSLIDEMLLGIEAVDLGIFVEQQELEDEVSKLFSVLGVCDGLSLGECVEQNALDQESVLSHIRSKVLWNKIMAARVRPFVSVSDSEIMDYILEAQSGGLEIVLDLEQVFVSFRAGEVLDSVLSELHKGVALDRIAMRYREHGVYVDRVVGAPASVFLPDARGTLLARSEPGEVVGPVKTDRGYLVLKLLGKFRVSKKFMNSRADIIRLSVSLDNEAKVEEYLKAKSVGCENFEDVVKGIGLESTSLEVRVRDLSSRLQSLLSEAKVGKLLRSTADNEKLDFIMLCHLSQVGGLTEEEISKIRQTVYAQKFIAASERLMESFRERHFTRTLT